VYCCLIFRTYRFTNVHGIIYFIMNLYVVVRIFLSCNIVWNLLGWAPSCYCWSLANLWWGSLCLVIVRFIATVVHNSNCIWLWPLLNLAHHISSRLSFHAASWVVHVHRFYTWRTLWLRKRIINFQCQAL